MRILNDIQHHACTDSDMLQETRSSREDWSEEIESLSGPHKRASEARSLLVMENELDSITGGEFDDVIRSRIGEGVVKLTAQTSKLESCIKPNNDAPSSPPKNKPNKNQKWFNGFSKMAQ